MPELITSKNNEQIKSAALLLKSAAERRKKGLFIIEGLRLCRDAFLSGLCFDTIFFTAEAMKKNAGELSFIYETGARCFEINGDIALRLTDTKSPQGIFCICKTLDKTYNIDKIKRYGRYIALENIQNPDNLGAIIRTAEALGIDGIIVSGGCDRYNPKVLRAAMGAIFRLPVFESDNLPDFLNECVQSGIKCYACVPDSKAIPLTKTDFSGGALCVIGNEGSGLSGEAIRSCSAGITIPMRSSAESLNAAGAAAIIIWEMMRRTP